MEIKSRIFISGHKGLVGSSVVRLLKSRGYENLLLRSHKELDLVNQQQVNKFFAEDRPDYVFHCAGKVGGIIANSTDQFGFLYENLMMAANVIKAAADNGVKKLLNLGSSCIYPRLAPQPISEEDFLSGPLEPTNEGYAIAKISSLKLTEKINRQYGLPYISVMPTNLYGPGDNFHPLNSHVIPGLLRRFHEAAQKNVPEVVVWGTGNARREFLFVDDLAEALYLLMMNYVSAEIVNIGTGADLSIRELSDIISSVIGYRGNIRFDSSYPDGMPRKSLNVSKINALGWQAKYSLENGLKETYQWILKNGIF